MLQKSFRFITIPNIEQNKAREDNNKSYHNKNKAREQAKHNPNTSC